MSFFDRLYGLWSYMGLITYMCPLLLSHPDNLKSIEAKERDEGGGLRWVVRFTYPGKGTVEFNRLSVPKLW